MSEVKRREENLLLRPPVVRPPLSHVRPSVHGGKVEAWKKTFFFAAFFYGEIVGGSPVLSREKKPSSSWGEKKNPCHSWM